MRVRIRSAGRCRPRELVLLSSAHLVCAFWLDWHLSGSPYNKHQQRNDNEKKTDEKMSLRAFTPAHFRLLLP